jgi:hypothetical protein
MFTNFLVWATLALSASALVTPRGIRSAHNHHAVSRRQIEPQVLAARSPSYQLRKRCSPRPAPSASSSSIAAATPSVSAAGNAGTDPDQDSQPTVTYQPSTSQAAPAYTPSSSQEAPPAASSPSGSSSSGSGNSGGTTGSSSGDSGSLFSGQESGDGTYYETGLGACGWTNVDTDMIAAIAHDTFDTYPGYTGANPNNNPICGKKVTAYYGGNSVTVTIVDRCAGCAKSSSLDFSPSAFSQLADQALGRIAITWDWES